LTGPRLLVRSVYLIAVAAALPLLMWNGVVQQINATVGDILFRMRGPLHSPSVAQIVLLAVDDATLSGYGPLPLRRSLLGGAIRRISEYRPRVVVIDMLLSEPGHPEEDLALSTALSTVPASVLGAAIDRDPARPSRWILPLPILADSHLVGHVHAEPDADGNVRSILLAKTADGKRLWALSVQAARAALRTGPPIEERDAVNLGAIRIPAGQADERLMRINYSGPEGVFHRISLASVLNGTARAEDFAGKIVMLGVTAQGGGDRMFTPVSSGIGMSGIEIHANAIRTILDRDFLEPLSPAAELAAGILIAAACIVGVGILRGLPLFAALAGIGLAIQVFSVIALRFGSVWPAGSLLTVFVATAGIVGAGEYAAVWLNLRSSERKRHEYAFRVQAIAHEIKTPLTAIQGSSEIISDQLLPEDQRARIATMIHKESKRLTDILHTFLDVERMASGSLQIQKGPVELPLLCEDVLDRARLYATRKRIRIESSLSPITVVADADLLSFAIYNLLTNAVKYSPKETTVTLAAVESRDTVSISVTDQGYGIAPKDQTNIFDRFYRLHREKTSAEEGTGIGLALVKEIAAQHGGRIEVESAEGTGSRFTIVLPKSAV